MVEILLTSEKFIKEVTNVSDNLSGKYLQSSIREAQEMHLKAILGTALLNKCKTLLSQRQLTGVYKDLVDECQYYLAYTTLADLAVKASYKITNFGLVKSEDEKLQIASWDEIAKNQEFYQAKADAMCYQLQGWILEHRSDFPELNESKCRQLRSNLYSSASCGIFLGGARGKRSR